MKKIITLGTLLIATATAFQSCSDVELPVAANSGLNTVTSLTQVVDGRSLTLSWDLPSGEQVENVLVYRDQQLIAELEGAQTTYYIERAPVNQDNIYTVKFKTNNGLVSLGQSLLVHIEYVPPTPPTPVGVSLPAAYLLAANSIEELVDDDERAAAQWFYDNYASKGKGLFIKINELDKLSPSKVSCLWIQCDLEDGTPAGWANLPYGLADASTIEALKAFHQDGGNLFLTKHAT
ncbi:MAG: DUF4960 domain-containing protein, partial [Bacteroidales bacterium]|nr:DUF4960 domain-containing protein [Bacteroidales bacterium]